MINPTIGLEIGETYTFYQGHRSNYFHPLGFAYYPDGAHASEPELEPGVAMSGSNCSTTLTCPAPMYFKKFKYLGVYSNNANVTPLTMGQENFGLDNYEPEFFFPLVEWVNSGPYSVKLRFDDAAYDKDLFYFCHVRMLILYDSGETRMPWTHLVLLILCRFINLCRVASNY